MSDMTELDYLRTLILDVEDALGRIFPSVSTSVQCGSVRLEWKKRDGDKHLFWEGPASSTELSRGSIKTMLDAVDELPNLIEALEVEKATQSRRVSAACQKIQQVLFSLA